MTSVVADVARAVGRGHGARGGAGVGGDGAAVRARVRGAAAHHVRLRAAQGPPAQGGDRLQQVAAAARLRPAPRRHALPEPCQWRCTL